MIGKKSLLTLTIQVPTPPLLSLVAVLSWFALEQVSVLLRTEAVLHSVACPPGNEGLESALSQSCPSSACQQRKGGCLLVSFELIGGQKVKVIC